MVFIRHDRFEAAIYNEPALLTVILFSDQADRISPGWQHVADAFAASCKFLQVADTRPSALSPPCLWPNS